MSRRFLAFALPLALALPLGVVSPAAVAAPVPVAAPAPVVAEAPGRLQTSTRSRPVAPGVTLTSLDRYGPDAYSRLVTWLRADALTADLTKGATVDYLFPGQVAKTEPLSTQANRVHAVAAINGDFFDINNSGAPHSTGIHNGQTIVSPGPGRGQLKIIGQSGRQIGRPGGLTVQ